MNPWRYRYTHNHDNRSNRARSLYWLGILVVIVLALFLPTPAEALPEYLASLAELPRYTYRMLDTLPHDSEAFTQGFLYHNGYFYESTGRYGQSTLRRVVPSTGEIDLVHHLPERYFGEGLCVFNDTLVQLTWREKTAFVYRLNDFTLKSRFPLNFEGWGLTTDGIHLIASDGSPQLYFLDPTDFSIVNTITVTAGDHPVKYLNELEYIDGSVYANVWFEDLLLIIDPVTGWVTGWVDLTGLRVMVQTPVGVLNGIAHDPDTNRLFITGKHWPVVFEIDIMW